MINKKDIIYKFVNNITISEKTDLRSSNLTAYYIPGTNKRVLKNYSTIIAMVDCDVDVNTVVINSDHYTQTTTVNQNLLRKYAGDSGCAIEEVTESEMKSRL